MIAAIKVIEIHMVLEQVSSFGEVSTLCADSLDEVLSAVNSPARTAMERFSLEAPAPRRQELLCRAEFRLDEVSITL
jgi:hypothetical protein